MVSRARAIVEAGIPVMGHVGLTPQSATMLGGFKTQGRTARGGAADRRRRERARGRGLLPVVLEAVPAPVAARITAELSIPTIGIGAGADCDGQVLVYHDLLGLYGGPLARFVKRYANLSAEIRDALDRLCDRGAERRVPRGAAHVRDAGRRAGGVRGPCVEAERGRARAAAGSDARERDGRRGARPAPAVHGCGRRSTSRTRSTRTRSREPAEGPVAGPPVVAAGAEEVLAVDRDPDRPEREERERERRTTRARARSGPAGSCRACRTGAPRRRAGRRRASRRRPRRRCRRGRPRPG